MEAPLDAPRSRRPSDIDAWLRTEPSLGALARAFPEEWQQVSADLGRLGAEASSDPDAVHRYIATLADGPGRGRSDPRRAAARQVRRHMAAAALRQAQLSQISGVERGRVRFNLLNGYVAQRLLFERDLVRKPVSMAWFRLVWPLVWQRRLLMPLVGRKGIYCFYSRALVRRLAALVDGRPALEIAAGDGTLARFLRDEGVEITATDDFSWSQSVTYGDAVVRQSARDALRTHRPRVVLCSWPPPGNTFERHVFRTPEVELYIMIGSRHQYAAGAWDDYDAQTAFVMDEDETLSRLVLPPELESAVYVFRRVEPDTAV